MPASLSLCVMTPGPPERVRALLELCREAVDEIVLVVDSGGDAGTLDACADLADRRFSVDCSSVVVALGWMLLQCRGDWVLRLDDDEVPGADLLAALPSLIADRFPTNIAMPRRWLHPQARSFVASAPWQPDHQVRLVRNMPGIWTFPGIVHGALQVVGERRLVPEPIYHADLLLSPLEQRRAKRDRFERQRPGHVADGFPVNDFYVPEDHGVETASVPDRDATLIRRVLGGAALPAVRPRAEGARHVGRAELERPVATRQVTAGAYAAEVRLDEPSPRLAPGESRQLQLVAENRGDEWWTHGDAAPHIRLGSRWLDAHSKAQVGTEARAVFTETVRPGRATRVMLRVEAPAEPGTYLLDVDVVHEHVRWFGCATRVEVEVVSR